MQASHDITPNFRDLYERLLRHKGDNRFAEAPLPWFDEFGDMVRAWFVSLSARAGTPVPPMSQEELWELYAFSRVNQLLLLGFQPPRKPKELWAPGMTVDNYDAFIKLCGMDIVRVEPFSPFFHEIVSVEPNPDVDALPRLQHEHWPAVMLGDMLISRAGVTVSAGKKHMRQDIAENSTLYWEFRRRNREVSDLSHGWGSNSQWRTNFRRDYLMDGYFHFNVDGNVQPSDPDPVDTYLALDSPDTDDIPLTTSERTELLTHRCFVETDKPHRDLFPFNDTWRTPVPPSLVIVRGSG